MKQELREQVWNKYDKHCAYCGNFLEYKDMQVDHIVPQRMGHCYDSKVMKEYYKITGKTVDNFDNLNPSCRRCNHYKRAYTLDEFRRLIKILNDKIQKTYLAKVAVDYGILQFKPFDGVFYFEKFN